MNQQSGLRRQTAIISEASSSKCETVIVTHRLIDHVTGLEINSNYQI